MKVSLRRLLPKTVAGQLTSVVMAAVLFGVVIASAVVYYLLYSGGLGPSRETLVQVRAARIAAVVNGVLEARSLADSTYITKHANGEPVSVTWAKRPPPGAIEPPPPHSMVGDVEQDLEKGWRLETLPHNREGDEENAIYIPMKNGQVLRFAVATHGGLGSLVLTQTLFTLGVITFLILFVSAWAVRWVTAPLSSIASAARRLPIWPRTGPSKSRRRLAPSTRCASACAASSTSAPACWSPSATICARR